MTRVNSAPKMSITSAINVNTPTRPGSGKGIRSLKSFGSEQKQTVSVYKRIESRPIGELDKNYTCISKLGRGGFAMVYLMRRREDGMFYAGKYQRLGQKERWDGVREAWLLNKLQDCKFVIKMIEFYQSPKESVIITEYLEGSDLFASLSEANFELTEAKCRVIVSQVLDALVYIHRLRVVHMDIKPNNILLASKDKNNLKVKIIDFGLAKEMGGPEKERCGMDGTLEFMAPEVIRMTYCTAATDMWSLGVLIYMLVSGGTSPFWAGTNVKTQRKILKAKFTMKLKAFEVLSAQIKQLIKRLLVLSPAKRLSARETLSHPWLSPDEKTVELSKCTKVETTMMRKYLARKRWKLLKDTIKWGNRLQGIFGN